MLKKILISALLTVVSVTSVAAEEVRHEVGESIKVWTGNEGVKVITLRYGKLAEDKALVQIVNADHAWDNKIQLMDVEKKGERRDYSVKVDGKKYVALVMTNYNYGELYLPGENASRPIGYNQSLSEEGKPQHFLTAYEQQQEGQTGQ
ncbi:hypothetical protein [Winslowiella iniecta]|uniref:Uncharacterized protein n=1 Tax=Winslowiella iniecta TaxID=1560201 RepID=A0A0L7TDX6_9GAMM|nr:hypothetical protein [Winslowiella iniecta]KOC89765.1 hypothetical protein NG42_11545 [Winslowiella iniecta]KOC93563.1 hypothetical protein NG43_09915 [Winslowiella iniecta]